jgi:hypothetical protein
MLAYLPAKVVAAHVHRDTPRPRQRRPEGGVEGDVAVTRTCQPGPGVLAPPPADERSGPTAELRPFQAVDSTAVVEDARRIDAEGLDLGRAVRSSLRLDR